jgi:hypothetical protein
MNLVRANTAFSPAFAPEALGDWLFTWGTPARKPKPTSIGLVHLVEGGQEGLFHEPWNPPTDEEQFSLLVEETIKKIQFTAQSDVSVYDRPQRYAVAVYSGQTGVNATPIATHKFLLQAPQSNSMVSDMTEGPTDKGALSLSMRLTEATTRTALMHAHSLLEAAQLDNQRMRERIANLENMMMSNIERYGAAHEKQLRATEELINRKHERDLKEQQMAGQSMAEREAWGFVKQIVPGMLETVTGGKIPAQTSSGVLGMLGPTDAPPIPVTEDGAPLVTLLRTVSPEQQAKLDALLTEEQRNLLHAAAQKEFNK